MRYVIKGASGGYYTECEIVGTRDCIEQDGTGNKFVHARHILNPKFDGREPNDASKFHEKQAAIDMTKNAFLANPKDFPDLKIATFDGSEIVEFPFAGY